MTRWNVQFSRASCRAPSLASHFRSSKYHFVQPLIQIFSERYSIISEDESERYFAIRPRQILRTYLARIFAIITALFGFYGVVVVGAIVRSLNQIDEGHVVIFVGVLVAVTLYVTLLKWLLPRRKTRVYKGEETTPLFSITPTSGIFITGQVYQLKDQTGKTLAVYRQSFLESLFQKRWHCYDSEEKYLFSAVESPLIMAICRRFIGLANFIPLHFAFSKGSGESFGSFTRKYTLRDRYRLDFVIDQAQTWLLVASAILLDTGEQR